MMTKAEIIESLKVWKEKKFYTWNEIAKMLNVSLSTVIYWISGEVEPSARNIRKILELIEK